ncbi:hypothetical protein LCGC14_2117300, partial [marine sediment metagenome]
IISNSHTARRGKETIPCPFYKQIDGFSFLLVEHTARRDGENSETDTWLVFAKDCKYISEEDHHRLTNECNEVGAMFGSMIKNPTSFLLKSKE